MAIFMTGDTHGDFSRLRPVAFREQGEQIWFVHKDEEGVYVYSLADFTAQQGVRDTTDVMEKYRKGALGALPDPELINSLLSIKSGVKGDDADAK